MKTIERKGRRTCYVTYWIHSKPLRVETTHLGTCNQCLKEKELKKTLRKAFRKVAS